MFTRGESNFENFLGWTSPRVSVHYHTQTRRSSSSSEEVRRPRIGIRDIWSAYEEWSYFGAGVPLSLENIDSKVTQYYHRFLHADHLGYLYFQYNETRKPFERDPLTYKISELAEQDNGLYSLMSSDLSPYSWISVAWYPIYQIPSVTSRPGLSASFLTYHSLTPYFPGTL
ncbi:hypothetical protein EUTSA_v100054381mg, partial [Eutrema salsugineum]